LSAARTAVDDLGYFGYVYVDGVDPEGVELAASGFDRLFGEGDEVSVDAAVLVQQQDRFARGDLEAIANEVLDSFADVGFGCGRRAGHEAPLLRT